MIVGVIIRSRVASEEEYCGENGSLSESEEESRTESDNGTESSILNQDGAMKRIMRMRIEEEVEWDGEWYREEENRTRSGGERGSRNRRRTAA